MLSVCLLTNLLLGFVCLALNYLVSLSVCVCVSVSVRVRVCLCVCVCVSVYPCYLPTSLYTFPYPADLPLIYR